MHPLVGGSCASHLYSPRACMMNTSLDTTPMTTDRSTKPAKFIKKKRALHLSQLLQPQGRPPAVYSASGRDSSWEGHSSGMLQCDESESPTLRNTRQIVSVGVDGFSHCQVANHSFCYCMYRIQQRLSSCDLDSPQLRFGVQSQA